VPFQILERNGCVASSWRRHYDRLHLHTPKRQSALPFVPFPKEFPRYPSRDQVIQYLDDYARTLDLRPVFGVDVLRCERSEENYWNVHTSDGVRRARHLVIASGFSRVPHRPSWPGLDDFSGRVLHSRDYVTGQHFRSQRVLVVGFGNSGAEIALDLSECGADSAIAIRGSVNVIPRDILDIPVAYFALATQYFSPSIADRLTALTIRLAVGNLARLGLKKRNDGPAAEVVEHRQVPVIDVGTLAAIRDGKISLRPAIDSFSRDEVRFANGRSERFDAIVLATGYETGLNTMFDDETTILDSFSRPQAYGCEAAPGLYFCGFNILPTGLLREISIEAVRIGERIAATSAPDGGRS
jgi:cation diffusion facilitator CzcD-associated flavoprotein CzcO